MTFNKNQGSPKCHYYCRVGRKVIICPYKKTYSYVLKNNIPTMLCKNVRKFWIVKGTRPPNMVHPDYDHKFATWSSRKGYVFFYRNQVVLISNEFWKVDVNDM